jgi:hypothetical protein
MPGQRLRIATNLSTGLMHSFLSRLLFEMPDPNPAPRESSSAFFFDFRALFGRFGCCRRVPDNQGVPWFRPAIIKNADEWQMNTGVLTHTQICCKGRFPAFLQDSHLNR